jgi:hypothetical protein
MNPNALPPDISSPVTHGENKFISRDNKRIKLTNPDELQPDISTDGENKSVSKGTGEHMYTYALEPCMENERFSMFDKTKSIFTEENGFGGDVKKLGEVDQKVLDAMVKEAHVYNITRFMGGYSFYFGPP